MGQGRHLPEPGASRCRISQHCCKIVRFPRMTRKRITMENRSELNCRGMASCSTCEASPLYFQLISHFEYPELYTLKSAQQFWQSGPLANYWREVTCSCVTYKNYMRYVCAYRCTYVCVSANCTLRLFSSPSHTEIELFLKTSLRQCLRPNGSVKANFFFFFFPNGS